MSSRHKKINPKTLREYAGDLKQFISWFETAEYQEEKTCISDRGCGYPDIDAVPRRYAKNNAVEAIYNQSPSHHTETFF
jgi:hypothetical protein